MEIRLKGAFKNNTKNRFDDCDDGQAAMCPAHVALREPCAPSQTALRSTPLDRRVHLRNNRLPPTRVPRTCRSILGSIVIARTAAEIDFAPFVNAAPIFPGVFAGKSWLMDLRCVVSVLVGVSADAAQCELHC